MSFFVFDIIEIEYEFDYSIFSEISSWAYSEYLRYFYFELNFGFKIVWERMTHVVQYLGRTKSPYYISFIDHSNGCFSKTFSLICSCFCRLFLSYYVNVFRAKCIKFLGLIAQGSKICIDGGYVRKNSHNLSHSKNQNSR
jgi:hypothetical protein